MAIGRPAAINLGDISAALAQSSATQTASSRVEKSYDPAFPVFDVPVNQKVLAYIPKHIKTNEDGTTDLIMDTFLAHPVRDGRAYHNIRCSNGMHFPTIGWDGSCPLCNAVTNELWPLYHKEMDALARAQGLNPEAPETKEILKPNSKEWLQNRPIREAERWFTFPIVVVECEEGTLNPKMDEKGQLIAHPCYYSIREVTYNDKWVAGFDTLDGVPPTHPGGLWAVLNFTYQPKSGKPDKMGSAESLKVSYKTNEHLAQWAEYFDQLTAGWTVEKAMEVVALDAVRPMNELVDITDQVMKADRDKANLYNVMGSAPVQAVPTSADASLQAFAGAPQIAAPTAPAAPQQPVAPTLPGQNLHTGEVPTSPAPVAPTVGAPLGATPVAPLS